MVGVFHRSTTDVIAAHSPTYTSVLPLSTSCCGVYFKHLPFGFFDRGASQHMIISCTYKRVRRVDFHWIRYMKEVRADARNHDNIYTLKHTSLYAVSTVSILVLSIHIVGLTGLSLPEVYPGYNIM